ncbi:PQQ-dependent sugar dehydrogenase [Alteromonas sp. ASW11-19]|uniref:PQQ-dependent sugar dehydrogenase n=1 Tax=Alteromonas salexigens TaxID=2982530 RepID=A0ABT2VIY2_9ALTE|nr:PQQ-dependent sugar dehydrogenase [Alteromonas salexigens]MCU7553101.1 PQQ-dependent sugar dehydrogenase [Alteromonas salexigens]
MMMKVNLSLLFILLIGQLRAATADNGPNDYLVTEIATSLHSPWAAVQLPDQRWLITEMGGTVVTVKPDGSMTRQSLALQDLYVNGQGGLLDIALMQDFSMSQRVMLSYATGNDDCNALTVATASLSEHGELVNIAPLLTTSPCRDTPAHFGGRLAVLADGTWLVTTGDGFDYREQAQRLDSQLGKVLRFREDGQAPADNPFPDAPYVYSLGHRNPQGLASDPHTGRLYQQEHGPAGGDEINLLIAGENYGWPVVTKGIDYSGARISPFEEYPGMRDPLYNWTPSIAPSSMTWYAGNAFPALRQHLLVSALKAKGLFAINMSAKPLSSRRIFATIEQRIRDVVADADGNIVVLTDGESAALLKIAPE